MLPSHQPPWSPYSFQLIRFGPKVLMVPHHLTGYLALTMRHRAIYLEVPFHATQMATITLSSGLQTLGHSHGLSLGEGAWFIAPFQWR